MRGFLYVLAGAVFGFLLSSAGVTRYEAIVGMFLFRDFHLMGVMGSAIATAALGFLVLGRRAGPETSSDFKPKLLSAGVVAGGLVFGTGWALAGS
jgi:hypothetical protein